MAYDKLTIKCRQTTQRVPTNADNDVAGADKVSIIDGMTENKKVQCYPYKV